MQPTPDLPPSDSAVSETPTTDAVERLTLPEWLSKVPYSHYLSTKWGAGMFGGLAVALLLILVSFAVPAGGIELPVFGPVYPKNLIHG